MSTTYQMVKNIVSDTISKICIVRCLYGEDNYRLDIDVCNSVCVLLYDLAIVRHEIDKNRGFIVGDIVRMRYHEHLPHLGALKIIHKMHGIEKHSYAIVKQGQNFVFQKWIGSTTSYKYPSIIEMIQWIKIYDTLQLP